MADTSKAGRVVFIGNIPYSLTEEEIIHTLGTVGQVLNFRLVYDSDTGRPKGFGFAEFADTDSAASAVRNLNGHEIHGRELRVDFSHVGGKEPDTASASNTQQTPSSQMMPSNGYQAQPPASNLPPLPPGVDLPPNLSCPDAISKTLSSLQPPQLLDILSQMKGLVMGDPARATELLGKAPQLSYAIFQALLLMGLVDPPVLATVIEGSQPPPPPLPQQQQQQQGPLQQIPPQGMPGYQPPPHQPPQYGQYPPHMQQQVHVPTPPVHSQPFQVPQQIQQQQPPPPPPPPQQSDLIKQVLDLTQQQVDSMPPMERAQIMQLRQQYGRPMY